MPISQSPEWCCIQCGTTRWVGWRAGPAHEGFQRFAQCVLCGKVQDLPAPKPEEQTVTTPTGPDDPGAQDECATCSHARWRHKSLDGVQVCTEYVDCACGGHFVELSHGTRMARFVEAAQTVAASIATMRDALQGTMRATTELYSAMRDAGLIPDETKTDDTTGRHRDTPAAIIADPDHWSTSGQPSQSCATCWPRPCDPTRPLCRRNPDVTQAMPPVADQPNHEHEHGPSCVRYGCPNPSDQDDTR
jgi:hypothetical protein